jgi:uncharacterized phage protein gp47/JayE
MFQLPTLKDLVVRSRQSFRANLKGSDAWIWPNNIYVSAKVMAGQVFENFGYLSYIAKQMFAHTAPDIESLSLHGAEFGIPRKPAAPARGNVTFTSAGNLTSAAGAVLRRSDAIEFRVVVGGARTGAGDLELEVVATTDGATGNTEAGTVLEIISGVTGDATVEVGAGDLSLGVEVEDIESYRARILFRKRNPPHGGSPADYVMWAGSVSGVSFFEDRPTVFVERRWSGPGTVRVFPLMFDLYADGIPGLADTARVAEYLATVAPAGALVTVSAPTPKDVDIVIVNLTPDTTAVREAVIAEIKDAFKRLARVAGNDDNIGAMPYLAYPTAFSTSWIWQAVANASGERSHNISQPAANVTLQAGEYPVPGSITFV